MDTTCFEKQGAFAKLPNKETHSLIPEKAAILGRKFLGNPKTEIPAAAVYELVDAIVGGAKHDIDNWEIESIRIELKQHSITLTEVEENQILAISTLCTGIDLVFTSGNELKNVVLAINHEIPNVEIDEVVDVEHLAWFITFMKEYLPERNLFVDYGALDYVAGILYEEGYFTPPESLGFATDRLKDFNNNTEEYAEMVRKAIADPDAPQNTIVKAQMKKHESTEQYVRHMLDAHRMELRRLA